MKSKSCRKKCTQLALNQAWSGTCRPRKMWRRSAGTHRQVPSSTSYPQLQCLGLTAGPDLRKGGRREDEDVMTTLVSMGALSVVVVVEITVVAVDAGPGAIRAMKGPPSSSSSSPDNQTSSSGCGQIFKCSIGEMSKWLTRSCL